MGNFTYEVVGSYAELESLKVKAISYNGREPKFDIRHWSEKNGEEVMGKGVTLSIEEMMWLATELPKTIKKILGEDVEDNQEEDTEEQKEVSPAVQFMQYVVQSAEEKMPDKNELHGVMEKDGKSYATNSEMILMLNQKIDCIDKVDDNPKVSGMVDQLEEMDKTALTIGELAKFKAAYKKIKDDKHKYYYSFGKDKPTVNAKYLGKSLEALEGRIRYIKNGIMTVSSDIGTSIILPVKHDDGKVGLIKA